MAWAMWGLPQDEIKEAFAGADYRFLPVMLLLLVGFYVLKAYRWKLFLKPIRELTTWQVMPAMVIGFAFNNLLPAHLGEFVRVYVLGKQFDLPKTPVLSTVVLERVFDIIAILGLLGLSLFFIDDIPPDLKKASLIFGAVSLVGMIVLLVYMLFTSWFVSFTDSVLSKMNFIPESIRKGILEMLESGAIGLQSVRNPKLLWLISVTSLLQWLANGMMVYVALQSFGVEIEPTKALLVMGVTAIGVTVPSTPGYFGVIQFCFWESLKPFGCDKAKVFGASIYYHMCQWIPVTSTGLAFLSFVGMSFGDLKRQATSKGEPAESS